MSALGFGLLVGIAVAVGILIARLEAAHAKLDQLLTAANPDQLAALRARLKMSGDALHETIQANQPPARL